MSKVYLHLTEVCNMACKYCYMQQLKSRGTRKMSEETAYKAVDYMAQDKRWGVETIIFFGGEPMLEQGMIETVTGYINKEYPGQFNLSMITNGTLLTQNFIDFAEENNISIVLSYDGMYGPRNRVSEDGKELLVINTDWIKESCISALSVIDTTNVRYLHDNVKHLREVGFKRIQHVTNYDGEWNMDLLEILRDEWEKITEDYINWKKAGEEISLARLEGMVQSYARRFILDDMPEFRPLMGISVTGEIYPYPGAIGNEALWLGDVFTGFDEEKVNKLKVLPKVDACAGCDILDICPSAKGNILTDNLQPHSHRVSCESYKIMVDCAEEVLEKLLYANLEEHNDKIL